SRRAAGRCSLAAGGPRSTRCRPVAGPRRPPGLLRAAGRAAPRGAPPAAAIAEGALSSSATPHDRIPLPLEGEGWGGGARRRLGRRAPAARSPTPRSPPRRGGEEGG